MESVIIYPNDMAKGFPYNSKSLIKENFMGLI